METKPLLYGIIGFFIGGLLVSVAATTFNKPEIQNIHDSSSQNIFMKDMSSALQGKTGDTYDKIYLEAMIAHHEGAVTMSKQSAMNAKHVEIKELSQSIIKAQENEINIMKQWQKDWGYTNNKDENNHVSH